MNSPSAPSHGLMVSAEILFHFYDGNGRLAMAVGKGRCARDALPLTFDIGVFITI